MATSLGTRVSYIFERAAALKPGNLVEFARTARAVTWKPTPIIIADMLWCSLRYDFAFRDYVMWDVAALNGKQRKTWMTHPKSHKLNVMLNDPAGREFFRSKLAFFETFSDDLGREWLDLEQASPAELAEFLQRHDAVIAKPADGVGGADVERVEIPAGTDAAAFKLERAAAGQTLLEEIIEQHDDIAALYPGSVNTIRMITFLDKNDVMHVLAAVLRIGNGAAVDNFASGGMYTMLDENGIAQLPAVDKHSTVYKQHPVTGSQIQGFQVPNWDRVMALLESAVRKVPSVPYVGWDIAVTNDGAVLIEGNHNSSVFQAKPSVSGVKTGLLPVYREAIGFSKL